MMPSDQSSGARAELRPGPLLLGDESAEQAAECAKGAFASMQENGVAPTPQNFSVWYTFHTGRNDSLKRAIEILVSNRQPFTDKINNELYERFFTASREHTALRESTRRVQEILSQLMGELGTTGASTKSYNAALREISAGIQEGGRVGPDAPPIARLVGRLLEETAAMQRNTDMLADRLDVSANTINDLKSKLDDVRREALTDALTGIANRKAFEERLLESAKQAMETGEDLTLLLVDIDHFKNFNDTWGHQVGDQALRLVAKALTDNVKGQDLAARYGGEEFAVVLPKTALADAVKLADKIRGAFLRRRLVKRDTGETIGAITVSIGVAKLELGEPVQRFVNRADQALYAAKRGGRNRVVDETALDGLSLTTIETSVTE
jgi:diguanylate cyclase